MRSQILIVAGLLLIGAGTHAQTMQQEPPKETLGDAVRRLNGPVLMVASPPLMDRTSLTDLLTTTDIVVQGTLGEATSYPSPDQTTVYTDYVLKNPQVLLWRPVDTTPRPGPASSITFTQLGGSIIVDGQRVSVSHTALKPLEVGMEGIFFLVRREGKNFIARDYLGAFQVRDGIMNPLATLGGLSAEVRGKPIGTFRTQIADALKPVGP